MTTNVSSRSRRRGSASRSARSNASSTRRRMSSASSSVLSPGAVGAPLVVPEVGVRGAARHDQVVVRQPLAVAGGTIREDELFAGSIDRAHLGEEDLDVSLPPQDPADGRRDVAGRERGHRHLIEQRLEDVMIPAVENGEPNARAPQGAGGIKPAKAAADDDDMGKSHVGGACSPWYCGLRQERETRESGDSGGRERREGGGRS